VRYNTYIIIEPNIMLSKEFIEEMEQKLLVTKQQLQEEVIGLPTHTEIDTDIEATQDEAELDTDNEAVRSRIEGDIKKINAALAKIEDGTYGTDDEGKEISEERLRVLPWADKAL